MNTIEFIWEVVKMVLVAGFIVLLLGLTLEPVTKDIIKWINKK